MGQRDNRCFTDTYTETVIGQRWDRTAAVEISISRSPSVSEKACASIPTCTLPRYVMHERLYARSRHTNRRTIPPRHHVTVTFQGNQAAPRSQIRSAGTRVAAMATHQILPVRRKLPCRFRPTALDNDRSIPRRSSRDQPHPRSSQQFGNSTAGRLLCCRGAVGRRLS
jgi:hypothetical protein